jgi:hypothetical protein
VTPGLPFGPHPCNPFCLGREPKARVATITKVRESEKYDSTRLKEVRLQDEHAPLEVRVFHREDDVLG